HKRGSDFPAEACGISYGKGQPKPMRLSGGRAGLMAKLLQKPCFRRIAHYQSATYAAFSPTNYRYYFDGMKRLSAALPELEPNFPNSVFACLTINFGPRTRTHIHTDSKNTPHGMCAITSCGKFNYKLGGHLVLWDLNLVIEFPPGCTILIPSALLLHSNIGVQPNETRYSITQYTAGGIWRWLDGGGQAEEKIRQTDPAEFKRVQERKAGRREEVLKMFVTLDEIAALTVTK
ncbi:hypothetical protein K435DRAFT_669624, partial [Dendrothele bispora CBS 962.96]